MSTTSTFKFKDSANPTSPFTLTATNNSAGTANVLQSIPTVVGQTMVLTSVVIGAGVEHIGAHLFQGITSLTEVTFGPDSGLLEISQGAFNGCTSLANIAIPEKVTIIGFHAFYGCNKLVAITLPEGLTSIGEAAFRKCSSLVDVSIPTSVTTLGEHAFSKCSSLVAVSIPTSVTSIGESAFDECTSLAAVSIPTSVTSIGKYAFWGCWSLKSVTFPKSLTSIGTDAFRGSGLTKVTLYYGNIFHKSPAKNVMFGGTIVDIIIIGAPRLQVLPMIFSIENGPPLGAYHRPNSGHGTPGGVACKRHVKNRT